MATTITIGDGHLARSPRFNTWLYNSSANDHHLFRRDYTSISSPEICRSGDNVYYIDPERVVVKSDVWPALFYNRYSITWLDSGDLYADSFYYRHSVYGDYSSSGVTHISFVQFNTSTLKGISYDRVRFYVNAYNPKPGGGACMIGFITSDSSSYRTSYEWITSGINFAVTAANYLSFTFTTPITLDDYLYVSTWIEEYEVPTTPGTQQKNIFNVSRSFHFYPVEEDNSSRSLVMSR